MALQPAVVSHVGSLQCGRVTGAGDCTSYYMDKWGNLALWLYVACCGESPGLVYVQVRK